jgi:hypothetical protein
MSMKIESCGWVPLWPYSLRPADGQSSAMVNIGGKPFQLIRVHSQQEVATP